MSPRPPHVLCLASFFKGGEFMRECAERGARVSLVTREKLLGEDWPRDCLAEVIAVPPGVPVARLAAAQAALAGGGRLAKAAK